jgi:hypothetical protein
MNELKNTLILSTIATLLSLLGLFGLSQAHGSEELECVSPTHCVLMSLPRWHEDLDEPEGERFERLRAIGDALDSSTDDRLERAIQISLAYHESRLARFVDLDWPKCREGKGGWCDSGKALGVIQAHVPSRDISRAELFGFGVTRIRTGGAHCKARGHDYVSGAFSLYGTGRICDWKGAEERAEMAWDVWGKLR